MMHDSGELPGAEGEHRAQEMFGTATRALAFYNKQVLDFLNPLMCEFIRAQQMMFIATSDGRGHADSSLRAGPPGFVHVLDARTLIYPEYRGNGVMASVGNLLENPHIGLLFIDFVGSTIGLHVNGKARIVEKFELLDSFINSNSGTDVQLPLFDSLVLTSEALEPLMELTLTRGGRQPERWIAVQVAEAYIHCSKHIPKFLQLDKQIHWGTDDDTFKGGDAFKAKNCPRPWVRPQDLNATPPATGSNEPREVFGRPSSYPAEGSVQSSKAGYSLINLGAGCTVPKTTVPARRPGAVISSCSRWPSLSVEWRGYSRHQAGGSWLWVDGMDAGLGPAPIQV